MTSGFWGGPCPSLKGAASPWTGAEILVASRAVRVSYVSVTLLPLRLGVGDDFRNPADSGIETSRLYAEILDQVAWLDGLDLDLVWSVPGPWTLPDIWVPLRVS